MNPLIFIMMVSGEQLKEIRSRPEAALEIDQESGIFTSLHKTFHYFLTDGSLAHEGNPLSAVFGTELVECPEAELGHIRVLEPEGLEALWSHLGPLEMATIEKRLEESFLKDLVEENRIDDIEVFPNGESEEEIAAGIEKLKEYYREAAEKGYGLVFYEVGAWSKERAEEVAAERAEWMKDLREALEDPGGTDGGDGEGRTSTKAKDLTKDELMEWLEPHSGQLRKVAWEHRRGFEKTSGIVLFNPDKLHEDLKEMLKMTLSALGSEQGQGGSGGTAEWVPFGMLVDPSDFQDLLGGDAEEFGDEFMVVELALSMGPDFLLMDPESGKVMMTHLGEIEEMVPSPLALEIQES
jgi:hypothetical protein